MNIKKIVIVLFLLLLCFSICAEDINNILHSANRELYTDFVAVRMSPYLKKPKVSFGYIVADRDKFLFKQTKPIKMEVRQENGVLTIKLPGDSEIVIDGSSEEYSDDVMFLFDSAFDLNDNFVIKKDVVGDKDYYELLPNKPKLSKKISLISLVVKGDSLESMTLTFKNRSTISYEFKNTITGVKPDESLF